MTSDARETGIQRLAEALAERERAGACYAGALGTSSQLSAYAALRGADDQVAAREAWLELVEKGLSGGPAWFNGRRIGKPDPRFLTLDESHD
jgi:hypothetical protein